MQERVPSGGRKGLLAAIVACGVLVVLEGGLRLVAASSERAAQALSAGIARALPDARLGKRPNPALPDHDGAGWRNAQRPARVALVAIGDSQTYGEEVAREQAWPQRLAARTGLATYGLALGGYGPLQYERLLDDALELSPERVLVGLYAGNDLANAYAAVVREGLAPELAPPAAEREALLALDAHRGDLATRWRETKAARRGPLRHWLDATLFDPLGTHSRLFGLGRALLRLGRARASAPADPHAASQAALRFAGADPALLLPVGDDARSTVLTPALRAATLDPQDPRVAFGLHFTFGALDRMARRLPPGALWLVAIPTKELVFAPVAEAGGAPLPPVYRTLLRDEARFWERVDVFARERGIPVVAALPALRAALAAGRNPYPRDWNGHPNAVGNDAIAAAVAARLRAE